MASHEKMLEKLVGHRVVFRCKKGQVREGIVDSNIREGGLFTIQRPDGSYRSFYVDECETPLYVGANAVIPE